MKKLTLIATALLITSLAGFAQKKGEKAAVTIVPLGDTVTITDKALIYALPMTVFEIEVTLERTVEKPGPYASFSTNLLGVSDFIKAEREEWTIGSVEMKPLFEVDPAEYYILKSNTPIVSNSLVLSNQGLIVDINSGSLINRRGSDYDFGVSDLRYNDLGANRYSSVQSDTAYRVVKVDSAFLRIPYLVEKKKLLTTEQLAELAARTLLELREGRHLILTGEATVFPQNDAAINEINRLEKEYMSLFIGKTWSETVKFKIYYTPDKNESLEKKVLFRLSEERGMVESGGNTGTPVTIALVPTGKTKPLYASSGIQLVTSAVPAGLTYRIPEVAEVTIQHGNSTLLKTRAIVYQLGQKVLIPENILLVK